ncbi:MAG: hypothetical protein NTV52_02475 [Acidobacteria bacterium]|nr:hypothetical protein [Acidobacteriota bacterium]
MLPSPVLLRLIALLIAASLAAYYAALARFDPSPDEAWMVLVTQRLAHGQRLYQDVFCGVTPLAFQFQLVLQNFFGPSIALVRALTVVLYALSALLTLAAGLALRLSRFQLSFVLVATLLWTIPENSSTYNPLALLFALAAQYCAIRLFRSQSRARWAAAAGLFAGLAFATKQNIGLLCLLALLAVLALSWPRLTPFVAGAFVFAATLPLLPIALSGGLPAFIHFGFFNKTVYAQVASLSYLAQIHLSPRALWNEFGFPSGTLLWGRSLRYLAPFLLLAVLPLAQKLGAPRLAPLRMQLVFALASLGFVYPRPDGPHIALCAPFVALSLPLLARLALPHSGFYRLAAWAGGAVLLLQFGVWLMMIQRPLPATVAHGQVFRGLRVSPEFAAAAASAALRLPAEQSDPRGIFVLHPGATIIYLASGVPNPTLYDYPLNSAFGPDGQQQLIRQIRDGAVPTVCLPDEQWTTHPLWRVFAPRQLIDYVRTEMRPGPDLSACRIYLPR